MSWLGPRQKFTILQHLDTMERLISHVTEHARLGEEQEQRRKEAKRRRSVCVKPWIRRRPLHGQYEQLMKELHAEDVSEFTNYATLRNCMRKDANGYAR